ncbi:uncharacterized protein [Dermacentor andersoni]|uniref:uncharacterized protein n=1 Tax=Dermacentor andersoni TaxID=34620 RepID=UPI0024159BE7|nr:uncharacterized protein LOC129385371 [Dermacentor andersoni]
MIVAAIISASLLYSACIAAKEPASRRKGQAPTTGPSSAKPALLCGNLTSCNLGEKRVCLLTDGVKSPPKCIHARARCKDVWKSYCKQPEVPICKDDITECLCSCGQQQGYFDTLWRHSRSVSPVKDPRQLLASAD